jgi:hypothetical protein
MIKLVKYPAHSVDSFIVTSEEGLKLLKSGALEQFKVENRKVAELIRESISTELKQGSFGDIPFGVLCFEMNPTADSGYGVEMGTEELAAWQLGAVGAILKWDLGFEVRYLKYGSPEHKVWLQIVQD